jgi:hypothetical protein
MSAIDLLLKLNELERDALTGCPTETLLKRFKTLSAGYSFAIGNPHLPVIYRARRNETAKLYKNVCELWHPPVSIACRGRLNKENCPLLYASSADHVAMWELKPKVKDIVTILEVKQKSDKANPKCVTVSELSHIDRTRRPIFNKGSFFLPKAFHSTIGIEKYQRAVNIDRTIGNWFATDGDTHYDLTRAVAEFYFSIPGLDGIIYPSVAWGGGLNVALLPDSANRLFQAARAFVIEISDQSPLPGQCAGKYVAVSTSIDPDGTINWQ